MPVHEFDRLFSAPMGLMQPRRHSGPGQPSVPVTCCGALFAEQLWEDRVNFLPGLSLRPHPSDVFIFLPHGPRAVAPVELLVPVVDPLFRYSLTGRQVKLSGQPAHVSAVPQNAGHQHFVVRDLRSVLPHPDSPRVSSSQEAARLGEHTGFWL